MKLRTACIYTILSAALPLYAQENSNGKEWTLQECINYALEKNIQLQQNKISLQESEIDIKDARASLFPSLSFSTGHNVVNRPYQEQSNTVSGTEIISSDEKTTYNGNYSLNAQWTLWNGGQRLNNLKQQKTNRDIARLTVSETENTLQEQITQLFIQILYADESIQINRSTLEVSKATYKRGQELFAEGSLSKADLAQLEAQVSDDQYQLVTAESTWRNYKLQLKQLLELDGSEEFNLVLPELNDENILKMLPSQTDVYQAAMAIRPEIQSSRLSIENAKLGISAAKAGYYPTISLSASSSSTTNSASTNNWAQQMKYGWNNMIGISLSIPIFDNRQNKSNVQKARLQYNTSQLDLINKQKELYSTIEGLWLDALNAQQQYVAAETKVKSSQTSFDMVNEQFNLGMKNTVELLTEKNNLLSAKQQLVQAKYMAILNRTLLNFYAGNNIEL
ncbi:TolC family protein [Bacteroides gallinaceum]|uniref:TolC family protein n=1 Tax=Bacteroides gallinaceum TaxID=1462571 RepID=A0ABT7X983_9BACE|nr:MULTISPECIES: TolC family protein [Bacteroides]HJD10295.1 TolC family protein [Candidatus Phocaeicola caecigallinarum]MBM6659591.1 TolC family protein [Bacteroides gallinaceum]MBM6720741.1 TolC family protein [Bacteroides gallinaceum]MBM6945047.1 TolC family protein [Bacteroides gallinaceum]MDN0050650.1 TolC family protein [Bacteroides gallinaceum]